MAEKDSDEEIEEGESEAFDDKPPPTHPEIPSRSHGLPTPDPATFETPTKSRSDFDLNELANQQSNETLKGKCY